MTAFDTNILIYSCDHTDRTRQARALDLIASASDAVLLWQVACEFIAASRKLAPQGFTPEDARNRLADFLALELHLNGGCALWDAMIVGACLEHGVTRLYSEDLPVRMMAGIEIVNPFA